MVTRKAYKIQDVNWTKRIGIVANNFNDLKKKGKKRLAIAGDCRVCLEDGTIVDDEDYFITLPHQTVFVFVQPNETWEGCKWKVWVFDLPLPRKLIIINSPGVSHQMFDNGA